VLTVVHDTSGYLSETYVQSLFEVGSPVRLERAGAWVLRRRIPGTDLFDFMGAYPLLCCESWSGLAADVAVLDGISFTGVTDPLAPEGALYGRPFKTHFLARLDDDPGSFVHPNHRRKARRALERCTVDLESPSEFLEEWAGLYGHLSDKHGITDLRTFSYSSFELLLQVPGLLPFVARREGVAVAAILVLVDGDRAYYHLGASSSDGYEIGASFGLFWKAMEHLRGTGVRVLCLGSSAGLSDKSDGLSRFKAGWSNDEAPSFLITRILDRDAYDSLSQGRGEGYFPAYRSGEFG
jgi:hypothetical protein